MATIGTILIRVISLLGKRNKLTGEVGGGKRTLDDFFPLKKPKMRAGNGCGGGRHHSSEDTVTVRP
jgi:hypothetical protein